MAASRWCRRRGGGDNRTMVVAPPGLCCLRGDATITARGHAPHPRGTHPPQRRVVPSLGARPSRPHREEPTRCERREGGLSSQTHRPSRDNLFAQLDGHHHAGRGPAGSTGSLARYGGTKCFAPGLHATLRNARAFCGGAPRPDKLELRTDAPGEGPGGLGGQSFGERDGLAHLDGDDYQCRAYWLAC